MTIKDAIFGVQSPQKRAAASDDLQGSLPIADIDRGIIHTRDGGLVGLFEVLPMNFFLQSTAERVRIVGALAAWLKIAPSSVQFLCLSQPVDVEQYTRRMNEYAETETVDAGGVSVTMKGENGLVKLAVWTNGDYSYALSVENAISQSDMAALVSNIQ